MMKISNKTIERFKQNDQEAFAEIFYCYREIVYAFAKHKLKNEEDANDCVQEVFQKLFMNIHQYDIPRNNFNAWFIQVAKNHIIDVYRRIQKEKFILDNNYIALCKCKEKDDSLFEELQCILTEQEYNILVYRIVYQITFYEIGLIEELNREKVRRMYRNILLKSKSYLERIKNYEE